MAGLRVGFIVGDPGLIAELEQNYFTSSQLAVSNLSMAAALASLKDEEHRRSSRLKNEAAKNYTTSSLAALNIKCIPSFTNFIYFPLGKYPGDFSASMLTKNILLRSYNSSPEKWARVSIGTMDEMKEFIKIMKSDWKA
jgi:histidinol-phosphate aminotransferase